MASHSGYRRWRVTVAFIATLNFIAMVSLFARRATHDSERGLPPPVLFWREWCEIVLSVVFFIAYWYSRFGKGGQLHRFVRAFLLLGSSVLLLYLTLDEVHVEVSYYQMYPKEGQAFSCNGFILCILLWVFVFMSIILGFFVVFDVGITLKLGPCEPRDVAASGLQQNHPSVVIVSPEQGYHVPQQQYYAPQPGKIQQQYYALQPGEMQQQYYQPPLQQLHHDSSYKIDQNEQPQQSPVHTQYSPQASPLPQHFQQT